MADYISREDAISYVKHAWAKGLEPTQYIENIPAADVVERKRGEWIYAELDNFRKYSVTCPFCRTEYTDNYDGYVDVGNFNFCPNCGEDLRGADNG